ncbi:GH92 family glycosyl hydrolase [Acidicapsa dinghuensis]|uniref:GH92 family glycosyl hydrolase n=1 Tax=Acidicapsa dinghuensis TaxID=2218256 RepID=A0ABW1EA38_9BACT|nr:GH92 family glycosyl hydrolase [Acidicapsa dinghuensis]
MKEAVDSKWTRRRVLQGMAAAGAVSAIGLPKIALADGPSDEDLLGLVNIFWGTGGHGHTYPGATMPFGMVQLSPDTYNDDWDWCSGYHNSDVSIMGFSHTHLSGTGCGDLLDFLVVPRTGDVRLHPGDRKSAAEGKGDGYRTRFSHEDEHAHPGYYSVLLKDTGIQAELTATERAGFHRYTFPESDTSHIVLDLTHAYGQGPGNIEWCSLEKVNDRMLVAGHATNAWGAGRQMYIALEFSRPFDRVEFFEDDNATDSNGAKKAKNLKAVVYYKTKAGEKIQIKAGLSGVSTDGARKNLAAEIHGWDFDAVQKAAEGRWREELGKIRVESASDNNKRVFYSAYYHTMVAPTLFDDVDGRYMGMDGGIHQLPKGQHNYTTFSLWDTYRAEHPLFTMVHADRVPDMINSLIHMAEQSPAGMPVWPLQGKETGTMTGYHSAAVITEAMVKGFEGIDYNSAYTAMKKRAFDDDYRGLNWYRSLGYIPCDREDESVSKTLEYDYDDWAVSHVADRLGDKANAEALRKRSRNYRNYWDQSTGFLRPKFQNGQWAVPFDPIELGHSKKWRDYTESNAWQTTFGIQHDVTGYIQVLGGDEAFVQKLDTLFDQPSTLPPDAPPDIAGMVGQYAHGNEPSHHIAYLYSFAGRPDKTAARIHMLNTKMYSNALDGMAGNEDCGQMSAWYVLSSIGFYSVDPVSTHYVFGSPLFDRVTLQLAGGKKLVVEAKRQSADSVYIKSVELDGKPHANAWFAHADVAEGGRFVVEMTDAADPGFGRSEETRPKSSMPV